MAITVLTDSTIAENTRTLTWTIPTLATGDVVVVVASTWDQGNTLNVPTGTGLSFTQAKTDTGGAGSGRWYIWTATASSGGSSVVVTSSILAGGACEHAGSLYLCPTADGYSLGVTPNTVYAVTVGAGTPSASLSGASGNLAIFGVGDWSGGGYPGRTLLPSGSTQDLYQDDDATYINAHGTLTGSSTTIGLSGTTSVGLGQTIGIEVLKSAGGGSNAGALSGTLPKVTGSIAGTSTDLGTLAATLTKVTASLAGTATNTGTASATLPVVTGSLSGTSTNPGTTSGTLPVVTGSLTGTATNVGTLSATLPKVVGSIADTSVVNGTLVATLPKVTGSITGTATNAGTITVNLPSVTGSITGQSVNSGTLAATLPKVTGSIIEDASIVTGALNATLPKVTASLTGTAVNVGTLVATLPKVRGSITSPSGARNITVIAASTKRDISASIPPGPTATTRRRWSSP